MPDESGGGRPRAAADGGPPRAMSASAQPAFVRSAYGAAEGAIRLADEKVGYLLLFLGILVATVSVRADAVLSLLTTPQYNLLVQGSFLAGCVVFLGAAGMSLAYAARSRALALEPPADVAQALARLAALETAGLVGELARALHQAAGIADRKFTLLRICLGWEAMAFVGWALVLTMSVAF
jgi:hypothetical protein